MSDNFPHRSGLFSIALRQIGSTATFFCRHPIVTVSIPKVYMSGPPLMNRPEFPVLQSMRPASSTPGSFFSTTSSNAEASFFVTYNTNDRFRSLGPPSRPTTRRPVTAPSGIPRPIGKTKKLSTPTRSSNKADKCDPPETNRETQLVVRKASTPKESEEPEVVYAIVPKKQTRHRSRSLSPFSQHRQHYATDNSKDLSAASTGFIPLQLECETISCGTIGIDLEVDPLLNHRDLSDAPKAKTQRVSIEEAANKIHYLFMEEFHVLKEDLRLAQNQLVSERKPRAATPPEKPSNEGPPSSKYPKKDTASPRLLKNIRRIDELQKSMHKMLVTCAHQINDVKDQEYKMELEMRFENALGDLENAIQFFVLTEQKQLELMGTGTSDTSTSDTLSSPNTTIMAMEQLAIVFNEGGSRPMNETSHTETVTQ